MADLAPDAAIPVIRWIPIMHRTLLAALGIALVSLLCMGCHYQPMSEIAIDPTLSAEQQAAIVDAAGTIDQALGDASPVPALRIGANAGRGFVTLAECAEPSAYAETQLRPGLAPVILICTQHAADLSPADLRRIVMHELGHALTLTSEHLPAGNIMAPSLGEAALELTALDVAFMGGL